MALTEPSDVSSGETIFASLWNTLKSLLFDAIGTQTFTNQYYVTNDNSSTENIDALDDALNKQRAKVALTDQATITTDASQGFLFTVTLTDNRTLATPTNPTDGQRAIWRFTQDGTGSRTITLDSVFRLGTDIPSIILTTTAAKTDYMGCIYNSAATKWDVIAFNKGF
jgi:hypothetical protein